MRFLWKFCTWNFDSAAFNFRNISQNYFFDSRPFWLGFIKGIFCLTCFYFFLIIKHLCSQNRMNRCDCLGPDVRLDTKIDQFDLCHISMSYASYDIEIEFYFQIHLRQILNFLSRISSCPSPHAINAYNHTWPENMS
jgi:hypothetical protein